MRGNGWQHRGTLLLMATSGFAGLGYQIVWTQQCALWLGHEAAAVLAVVTAFFGGLALGAFALGERIESSTRPRRWYAACELLIGCWSMLLAVVMAPASDWLLKLTGALASATWQWTVAFGGTFLLLVPATAAMGATLPAMERLLSCESSDRRSIAALYASNTAGAVIGVLACSFWLLPTLGLTRAAVLCAALSLLCAAGSSLLFAGTEATAPKRAVSKQVAATGVLVRLAFTGLLGIGYEVLVVRVLSQVAEDTVYTFAMLLAVYLLGSAAGAAGYQRWLLQSRDANALADRLQSALAGACLLSTLSLTIAPQIKAAALQLFGSTMSAAIAAETVLALVAFGPPTIVMGALFSHLSARAAASGASFGQALGANTLGAAFAPLLFGVLAFPLLGPKNALLLIAAGYLILTTRSGLRRARLWLPAAGVLVLAALAPPLAFVDLSDSGHVVSYQEGVMAAVSVVEDADGVARLRINNRQQEGSSASQLVDGRQALLPLLLHPAPKYALFLGLGTGVTATTAALSSPRLQVDAVELLPEVIAASAHFTQALSAATPNLHVVAADARRYVRAIDRRYDVIISDNFHPARSGSGSLYTVEHFAAVRARLDVDGVFCQWLPLHQLDLLTLRSIVRSFVSVYPEGWAMLASNSLETPVLGLVGTRDGTRLNLPAVRQRLSDGQAENLIRFGLQDEFALLGSFVGGPKALERFAGRAAANTDDFPIVAYAAPRVTYAPDSLPRDRLISLLQQLSISPSELLTDTRDEAWSNRLAAYWRARNHYVESGRDVQPSQDVRKMLEQVEAPLLTVLRISPDFRPAYDPLVAMATSLALADAPAARALLTELNRTQPARPEAQMALRQIDAMR